MPSPRRPTPPGQLLGESGLLEAARRLDPATSSPLAIGQSLLDSVGAAPRAGHAADDDVTLVVLHHNASASPEVVGRGEARRLRQGVRAQVGLIGRPDSSRGRTR